MTGVVAIIFTILAGTVTRTSVNPYGSQNYIIPILFIFFFLIIVPEIYQIYHYRKYYVVSLFGISMYDKIIKSIMIVLFLTLFIDRYVDSVVHYPRRSTAESRVFITVLALMCFFTWLNIFVYISTSARFGPFVLKVCEVIRKDLGYFFQFYAVINIAFGLAITLLTIKTSTYHDDSSGFVRLCRVCYELAYVTFGLEEIPADNILQHYNIPDHFVKPIYEVFVFFYSLCAELLLLNILIAMMNNTYEDFEKFAQSKITSRSIQFIIVFK
jgi:hypothetical protein